MNGSPMISNTGLLALAVGGFTTGTALAHLFSAAHQPPGTRYGSRWHAFQHWAGWTQGRIGHVRCVNMSDENDAVQGPHHIKAFGLVCETCGYVNVGRVLDDDDMVQDEIGGRSTTGFTWTRH